MSRPAEASAADPLAEIEGFVVGHGGSCAVGLFLPTLSEDRQRAIVAAAARVKQPGDKMTYMAIGKALRQWGFTGQPDTATRHLAGRCSCPR